MPVSRASGRRTRLLFVQHAGAGGAAVSLSQILRKLDAERVEATVLLLRADRRAVELLQATGARVLVDAGLSQFRQVIGGWSLTTPLGFFFTARSLLALVPSLIKFRRLLANLKPDLVYLNALPAFLYACPARRAGIPAVLHVREIVQDGPFGVWRNLYRRVIEHCVTETVYIGEYEKACLGARGSAQVIANYVDLGLWKRVAATPSGSPALAASKASPPAILFVGGLNPIKGIQVLLPALARLHARGVPFRWVCLAVESASRQPHGLKRLLLSSGKVQSYDEVRAFVEQAGLLEQSEFKPYVNDPVSEYAAADILVFPSTEPHFPRPLVEAGALGLPVVASNLPGPRSVVESGSNGLLVPARDPEALAVALERLLKDPDLRARMGQANYRVVSERHNAATNERCILDLIARYTA